MKDIMTVLGEWNVVKNYIVFIKMYKLTTYFFSLYIRSEAAKTLFNII